MVEADAVLGPERVRDGDVVIAMASSGFHSNGYSLVRRVVAAAGLDLHATPAGLDRPLGEELLEPTRIYARDCLAIVGEFGVDAVHAFAHITGGGLAGNTARVVPEGLAAVLDRSTWQLPAAVRLLEEHGVPRDESERAFNCGVGMVAAVSAAGRRRRRGRLTAAGVPSWVAGTVGRRTDERGPGRAPGRHLPLSGVRHGSPRVGLTARHQRERATTPRPRRDCGVVDQTLSSQRVNGGWRPSRRPRRRPPSGRRTRRPRRRRPSPAAGATYDDGAPVSSFCRAERSVLGELYLSSRATRVCLAFARPRPIGSTPSLRSAGAQLRAGRPVATPTE